LSENTFPRSVFTYKFPFSSQPISVSDSLKLFNSVTKSTNESLDKALSPILQNFNFNVTDEKSYLKNSQQFGSLQSISSFKSINEHVPFPIYPVYGSKYGDSSFFSNLSPSPNSFSYTQHRVIATIPSQDFNYKLPYKKFISDSSPTYYFPESELDAHPRMNYNFFYLVERMALLPLNKRMDILNSLPENFASVLEGEIKIFERIHKIELKKKKEENELYEIERAKRTENRARFSFVLPETEILLRKQLSKKQKRGISSLGKDARAWQFLPYWELANENQDEMFRIIKLIPKYVRDE
jgi:hypothetical protein